MLHRLRSTASGLYRFATDRRQREFGRQRRIVGAQARARAADRLARELPSSPKIPGFESEAVALERDGFVSLPALLSPAEIAEVRAYLGAHPCHDRYRPKAGTYSAPGGVPPETHISDYDQGVILRAPHLLRVANDPRVLGIVERALGAKPTIGALSLWWSTPAGEAEHAEIFHRDVDDLRFLKLFVYLTDVDEESGPHMYAVGSHRKDVLTAIRRYTDQEVEAAVGADTLRRFTGPAGTSFIENTYGLHRGLPPTKRPRLVFQPLYTLRPVIYGPRKPLGRLPAGLDPYVNRVFFHSVDAARMSETETLGMVGEADVRLSSDWEREGVRLARSRSGSE